MPKEMGAIAQATSVPISDRGPGLPSMEQRGRCGFQRGAAGLAMRWAFSNGECTSRSLKVLTLRSILATWQESPNRRSRSFWSVYKIASKALGLVRSRQVARPAIGVLYREGHTSRSARAATWTNGRVSSPRWLSDYTNDLESFPLNECLFWYVEASRVLPPAP
jgi:hypothetical protein